jgi:rod shape determining protein RodA
MREQKNVFQFIDKPLLWTYLTLTLIGWIAIYAAVYNPQHQNLWDIQQNYGKQMIWIFSSWLIMMVLLSIHPRIYHQSGPLFYLVTMALGLAVAFLGREVNGARAWFEVGSFRLQPAEFMKLSTAMMVAYFFANRPIRMDRFGSQILASIWLLIPVFLLLLQKDTGSALVYASFVLVYYREGLSVNYLIYSLAIMLLSVLTLWLGFKTMCIVIGVLLLLYVILAADSRKALIAGTKLSVPALVLVSVVNYAFENILLAHQKQRIMVLLGKVDDLRGAGYNVHQSLIAIGSGGFWGKGFLQGTQTKFDFVPEQSTDFIFCTIGEEYGFWGSAVLLGLFGFLLYRIFLIAERQPGTFGRVFGYSVGCIIFIHVTINIGMTLGLLPVIGIPLPMISYGGSSLWSFTAMIAILLRIDSGRMLGIR